MLQIDERAIFVLLRHAKQHVYPDSAYRGRPAIILRAIIFPRQANDGLVDRFLHYLTWAYQFEKYPQGKASNAGRKSLDVPPKAYQGIKFITTGKIIFGGTMLCSALRVI